MIKEDINKLLFVDIETVGVSKDIPTLSTENPSLYKVWDSTGIDYFKRRYPEDIDLSGDELFIKRASLIPEFGKIICVSVGFILPSNEIKLDTFTGSEKEILTNLSTLLNRVDKLDFILCGHNIKNFDLPYIGKRMLINEVWNFNSFKGLSSLELVCSCLNIDNPKDSEVNGSNMHNYYYTINNIEKIKNYCEEDIKSTIKMIKKISTCS